MIRIISLVVIASLFLLACEEGVVGGDADPSGPDKPPVYYLALGDSYTVGQSVPNDNFPEQIYDSLIAKGVNIVYPEVVARTGWTTTDLLNRLNSSTLKSDTFDFVTLCSGVNNQFRGLDTAVYLAEFDTLVKKSIEFAGNRPDRVWVLSIPDYAFTPFGKQDSVISREIDQYNEWNRSIALSYEVNYVDITDISRRGLSNPALISEDNLHPSGQQYTLWIERFLPAIKSLFD